MGSVQARLPIPYPLNGLIPDSIHPQNECGIWPSILGQTPPPPSCQPCAASPVCARARVRRRVIPRIRADISSDLHSARSVCHG